MTTKPKLSPLEKANAVRDYARGCNGSEQFYRSLMPFVIFTQGVHFLAETCGAHWLIDAIASHQLEAKTNAEPFQVWTLEPWKEGESVRLWAHDGNDREIVGQIIEFTDFPRELMPFKLYLEAGAIPAPGKVWKDGRLIDGFTLMLPEER